VWAQSDSGEAIHAYCNLGDAIYGVSSQKTGIVGVTSNVSFQGGYFRNYGGV